MTAPFPSAEKLPGPAIIVFHSDVSITALIARILEAAGYRVIRPSGISDVVSALERAERVDAIVIDPGDEPYFLGLVACRAARERCPSLPVILIADYDDRLCDPSISAVLPMPVRVEVLLAKVAALIGPAASGGDGTSQPCE